MVVCGAVDTREGQVPSTDTRGTTQSGQPFDVPGGHPARLIKEPHELRGMELKWVPAEPRVSSVKFHFKDFSEVEPDGREDRQSD